MFCLCFANTLPYTIAFFSIIYFSSKKRLLHFVKPVFRLKEILKAITNGVSELATTIATGLTALLMNIYLMKYVGENGVASYTIIYYIFTVMTAVYMGYVYGVAPMISYYHGNSDNYMGKILVAEFTESEEIIFHQPVEWLYSKNRALSRQSAIYCDSLGYRLQI